MEKIYYSFTPFAAYRPQEEMSMKFPVAAVLGAMLLVFSYPVQVFAAEAAYPARTIRMIVPFAAGGGTDVTARIVSLRLGETLGVSVVVDNRAGAGAMIGTELAARAAPDGHTLITVASEHAINPSLQPKVPYDAIRDFTPVSQLVRGQYFVALHPAVPARSVKDLIALGKRRPGEITYGSTGNGSATHLAGVLFQLLAGVKFTHVPYKGGGPASTALLGGEIALVFNATSTVMSHVKSGALRAVAVTGPRRLPQLPDLPTVAESALPGFEVTGWYLVLAPSATPREIVEKLSSEISRAVRHPAVQERFAVLGTEPVGSSPVEAAAFLRREIDKWTGVVKASAARPD